MLFGVFAAVALIDLVYLFLARYPGILTTDSYSTIAWILDGNYNNTIYRRRFFRRRLSFIPVYPCFPVL